MRMNTLAVLACLAPVTALAQAPDAGLLADSARREIEAAVLSSDKVRLSGARRLVERALTLYPKDGLLLHYRGYALYRQATSLGEPPNRGLLDEAGLAFGEAAKGSRIAENHILRWAVLGQSITDGPSAMQLGPLMEADLNAALRLGGKNPRVWLVQGISAFFTPPQWGGGADRALVHLKKAETLFPGDKPPAGYPAWGQAELHAWLGIVHQRLGHMEASRKAYGEALRIAPEFQWVKQVLIPALERNQSPFAPD